MYTCTVPLCWAMSIIGPIVHCTYCVPLCSFIGPIVTIVIPLHNHITVGPHTKCAESVLSMAHVSRFCNKEIGPKNYSKVCNHSTLGVTPASPSETVFANNRLCLCCRRNVKSFEFWRCILHLYVLKKSHIWLEFQDLLPFWIVLQIKTLLKSISFMNLLIFCMEVMQK